MSDHTTDRSPPAGAAGDMSVEKPLDVSEAVPSQRTDLPACPTCHTQVPQYSRTPGAPRRIPRERDAVVCLSCGVALYFTSSTAVRLLTEADKRTLPQVLVTAIEGTRAAVLRRRAQSQTQSQGVSS